MFNFSVVKLDILTSGSEGLTHFWNKPLVDSPGIAVAASENIKLLIRKQEQMMLHSMTYFASQ